ncbi:hypothetical protein [Halomicrobium salinisoli]|uniref:hypothetical protein n=1 Tax=Halomicrobium salinisoli TaxID=2878391 RepID=UPI001CF0C525|nr:hypothetical protein [Halomicrobium salinisoli]
MDYVDYVDEISPTVMIVFGLILFLIPEPASSALGAGLMVLGGAWLFYEWNR